MKLVILFVLFFLSWLVCQIFCDVVKAKMALRHQEQMINQLYSSIVRLTLSTIKDIKEMKKNVQM